MSFAGTIDAAGAVTLRFHGDLDASRAADVRAAFHGMPVGAPILVDLEGVGTIDAAGLGALIGGIRRVRDGGGVVVLLSAGPSVRQLLHTTGVDRIAVMAGGAEEPARPAPISLVPDPRPDLQSLAS
jgi:anti-sigma B factor antagonist